VTAAEFSFEAFRLGVKIDQYFKDMTVSRRNQRNVFLLHFASLE